MQHADQGTATPLNGAGLRVGIVRARFNDATLDGCSFVDANLGGATFSGARGKGARFLDELVKSEKVTVPAGVP